MAKNAHSEEIVIDFKVKTRALEELEDTVTRLRKEGQLDNTNGNTYKALISKIAEMKKLLSQPTKEGVVGKARMKQIEAGFSSISQTITKIQGQEKSAGINLTEYNKQLKIAVDNFNAQLKLVEDLQKKLNDLNVDKSGKVKSGQTKTVMEAALQASRAARGNKGRDTNAESLLRKGDLGAIKKMAKKEDGPHSEDAKAALELYNEALKKEHERYVDLENDLNALIPEYNRLKAIKDELESTSSYSEEAVKDLEEQRDAIDDVTKSTKEEVDQMEKAGVTHGKVAEKNKKLESSTTKAAKSFIKFAVVTRTIQKLVKEGIHAVVEMDKALTDMAIVTGESRQKLQEMIPAFNKLGRETGVTSTEVAGLTAEYMKQGRTLRDSLELAEQTAKAAKISGISAADSVEYMTSAINGFNLEAKDAEHVSDVFANLAAATATDYKDLAIALSKVSAQANTAGMSLEFTTTLLAKGLEVTQEAPESIGTALKTILARMRELKDYGTTLEDGASVNKVERALAAVDIQLRDTNGQFRDMEEIFTELGPKWDNINTMQQQAIAQAVAGTRQQSRFLAIMQDWDRTIEMSDVSLQSEGATMYQHSKYAESLEYSINELTTAWQGFISGLTNSNMVRDVVAFAADALSKITDGINWINEHTGGIIGTLVTMGLPLAGIISLIAEQVRLHREQAALTHAQYEEMMEANAQNAEALAIESAKTQEMREQVMTQEQLNNEVAEYHTWTEKLKENWHNLGDDIKDIGHNFKEGFKKGFSDGQDKNAIKLQKQELDKYYSYKARLAKLDEKKDAKLIQTINKKKRKSEDNILKARKRIFEMEERESKNRLTELKKLQSKQKKGSEEYQKLQEQINEETKKGEDFAKRRETIEKATTNEEARQAYFGKEETVTQGVNNVLTEEQKDDTKETADSQDDITDSKRDEALLNATNAGLGKVQADNEKKKGVGLLTVIKMKATELGETIGNTVAEIAGAFTNPVTAPFAITAAAVLATAGLATIGGLAASGGAKRQEKSKEKVTETQDKIYEAKDKKKQIEDLKESYEELLNKTVRTSEEEEQMADIADQLAEIDNRFDGIAGEQLMKEIDRSLEDLNKNTKDLIKSNLAEVKKGANSTNDFWDSFFGIDTRSKEEKRTDGLEYLKTGEAKLVLRQNADLVIQEQLANRTDLPDNIKREIISNFGATFNELLQDFNLERILANNPDMDINGLLDYLENNAQVLGSTIISINSSMSQADNANDSFIAGLTEFNTAIEQARARGDKVLEDVLNSQYSHFALLGENVDVVARSFEAGILPDAMTALAQKFSDLGVSSEAFANFLNSFLPDEDDDPDTRISVNEKIDKFTDEDWKKFYGEEKWNKANDEQREQMKKDGRDAMIEAYAHTSTSGLRDKRTHWQSNLERTLDLKAELADLKPGDKLTPELEEFLKTEYPNLYNRYVNNILNNSSQADVIAGLDQADKEARDQDAEDAQYLADEKKISFEKDYGVSYDDYVQGKAVSKGNASQAATDAANISEAMMAADDFRNSSYRYSGKSDIEIARENADVKRNTVEKRVSDQGFMTKTDYDELNNIQSTILQKEQEAFKSMAKHANDAYRGAVQVNEKTGEIIINTEKYNELTDKEQKDLDEELETLREQGAVIEENYEKRKQYEEEYRNSQLEMQNQAIEVMQARLTKEYEATQKSLEDRKKLYDDYFNYLDQEESTEDYEEKRAKLLNKIAGFSSATDANSIAAYKQAQKELEELDKQHLQNERQQQREAVNEMFDNEQENLESEYDKAMNNVQKLWEDFVSLQRDEQEKLFHDYGESFQNVTTLAAEAAEESLGHLLNGISVSFGDGTTVEPTKKKDPSQSNSTANTSASKETVDTGTDETTDTDVVSKEEKKNVETLAQGLRVVLSTEAATVTSTNSNNSININDLVINVDADTNKSLGETIADSFLETIKEYGFVINQQG